MTRIPVRASDVIIGEPLPWAVYDDRGVMLLRQGHVVRSSLQLRRLIERGAWHEPPEEEEESAGKGKLRGGARREREPFTRLSILIPRIRRMHQSIYELAKGSDKELESVAERLIQLVRDDREAMLAAINLIRDFEYSARHAAFTALLSAIMADEMNLSWRQRQGVVVAALTQNVGFFEDHDRFATSVGVLDEESRVKLRAHPNTSAEKVLSCGIDDPFILGAIREHHERYDGKGYPRELSGTAISQGGRILTLADHFVAMTSPRAYRQGLHPVVALRQIFLLSGRVGDPEMTQAFVAAVGVNPPGCCVYLDTGEQGMVVRRGAEASQPLVAVVKKAHDMGRQKTERFLQAVECSERNSRVTGPAPSMVASFQDLEYLWMENPPRLTV
ncbi:HD-GYP domain-containing protein (c-di-GMP phosphodiesterase class II) [Natronospira proteinivora]|uniref:HD-GYP domain-containing protein (C-di-GMP phosphodiesterase class II) n=1 Tax=Natronospira proteinivora TaxID=1807133 RepID=A0ABT1G9P7_9GAMM|nr:HD domain-containing phosphohydrolase [Natronospira proteinivora]MCP1728046.1 HD-GYP domain-containing protein (c-di-GMP phosphodiesterase class II) [Natronospira proteinivora]